MARRGAAALLVGVLSLSACASGETTFRLTAEETAGVWFAGGSFSTELSLAEDGALIATDWPEDLRCTARARVDVADLRQSPTENYIGTWKSYGGSLSYQLTLTFTQPDCLSGVLAVVQKAEDGALEMCVKVPPDVLLDDVTNDQIFALRKDSAPSSASGECR